MKKLEKLNDEQIAHMKVISDRFINIFNSGKEIDKEKVTKGINMIYRLSKLKKPRILFVSSPLGVQYGINLLLANNVGTNVADNVRDNVGDIIGTSVRISVGRSVGRSVVNNVDANMVNNVGDNVEANMMRSVGRSVWSSVRHSVWSSAEYNVGDNVRNSVGANVSDNVEDNVGTSVVNNVRVSLRTSVMTNVVNNVEANMVGNVWDNVVGSVMGSVMGSVRRSVRDNVRDNVEANVVANVRDNVEDNVEKLRYYEYSYYGDITDYSWVSFFLYFQEIGIKLGSAEKNFNTYRDMILGGIFNMVQLEGLCVVSELPLYCKKDTSHRMHCITGPAIEWRDGYKIYYINGIHIEENQYYKIINDEYSVQELLSIENNDTRALAYEYFNKEKFASEPHIILDSQIDGKGNEMKIIEFENKQIGRYYIGICPTTRKTHYLATTCNTCNEAKERSFGLKEIIFDNEF